MSTISMDDKCIIKPCAVPHNYSRVPTVMEKHGKKSCHGKWAKKIKSWKFKRSWKSHGISPLLIVNHA